MMKNMASWKVSPAYIYASPIANHLFFYRQSFKTHMTHMWYVCLTCVSHLHSWATATANSQRPSVAIWRFGQTCGYILGCTWEVFCQQLDIGWSETWEVVALKIWHGIKLAIFIWTSMINQWLWGVSYVQTQASTHLPTCLSIYIPTWPLFRRLKQCNP